MSGEGAVRGAGVGGGGAEAQEAKYRGEETDGVNGYE
jgi:hypothetical protein